MIGSAKESFVMYEIWLPYSLLKLSRWYELNLKATVTDSQRKWQYAWYMQDDAKSDRGTTRDKLILVRRYGEMSRPRGAVSSEWKWQEDSEWVLTAYTRTWWAGRSEELRKGHSLRTPVPILMVCTLLVASHRQEPRLAYCRRLKDVVGCFTEEGCQKISLSRKSGDVPGSIPGVLVHAKSCYGQIGARDTSHIYRDLMAIVLSLKLDIWVLHFGHLAVDMMLIRCASFLNTPWLHNT